MHKNACFYCCGKVLLKISTLPLLLAGCAAMPPIPDRVQFPINEILRYAACELGFAYSDAKNSKLYPNFKADQYALNVKLTPKAEIEHTLRAGLTDKGSGTAKHFLSVALGAATSGGSPGAGLDATGHQEGSAAYVISSGSLIEAVRTAKIDCKDWSPGKSQLAENLDIHDWVLRAADVSNSLNNSLQLDSQSFLAEVTIQFDGGGAFTYNFPLGTNFLSVSGRYKLDEALSITMTYQDKKPDYSHLVTLPDGLDGKRSKVVKPFAGGVTPEDKARLDILQLQQTLQNLQVTVPR